MQDAVNVLMESMPENSSRHDQAEEFDMLLHRFKRFIIPSKTAALKPKSSESYYYGETKANDVRIK